MRLLPNRRWLRFSIRTLLVAVVLASAWLAHYANWKHARANVRADRHFGFGVPHRSKTAELPFGLRLLGEEGYLGIFLDDNLSDKDRERVSRLFPESVLLRAADAEPEITYDNATFRES